ncbi:insulinase family protein [Fulvivirgaceae bacterium BMA10]|uniref:Insulinase family protein n=1 Tax=Splendidivirga corallicola TaxID=3051826 RepID=A0ABT8KY67_9BACT|nr:insulinase family protein [Fulvivirgaceae bacterium BMA10]MDN5205719.1 insulinase family protein [Fulvivirgaceae bacterium BMA10]
MKKYILFILTLVFISEISLAQLDRSQLPKPGKAREIQIGNYKSFTLKNGLKVFVVENHKLPRVSFNLVLDRGPISEGDKAGYLSMVGQMMRRGTTSRTKAQIDEEIDFIGASLGAGSSSVFGSSLTKHTETLLDLMTDILYNPTFPQEELDKIKTQTLSGLASQKDDPDAISGNVSTVLLFGKDHPYGELETEETVGNITIEDIRNYYQNYYKPNIAYLAIVGDINFKNAQKLVQKYFGKWEKGDVSKKQWDKPQAPSNTKVALVDRSASVQSVIDITYPVELKPGSEDAIKTSVLNQILGGGGSARLFMNLREDKGYTYGAYSSLSSDRLIGSFSAGASVRNEVTDSSIVEIIYELNKIRDEKASQEELDLAINSIAGSFARSLEQPQTIANFAINTARYNLSKDYYANYIKNVQAVTLEDVQTMAKKYIKPENAHIVVVGKGSEIADKLKAFGELKYYDIYGEEYTPKTGADLPADLTADKVIANYIKAIGGKSKLESVKNLQTVSEASLQGQTMTITTANSAPDKAYVSVVFGGVMEVQKVVFDGNSLGNWTQGQRAPEDAEKTKDAAVEYAMFAELLYKEHNVKRELTGVENIDGKEAYAIELTYPSGSKVLNHYSVESGLKIRQTSTVQGPQGEITQAVDITDYKEVDGILIPHTMKIPIGPGMKIDANIKSIDINKGVDESLFKID